MLTFDLYVSPRDYISVIFGDDAILGFIVDPAFGKEF